MKERLCDYCAKCGEKQDANCHDPLWCDGELCEFVPEGDEVLGTITGADIARRGGTPDDALLRG